MDYTEKYLKYKNKYLTLKKIIDNIKPHPTNIQLGGGKDDITKVILFKASWCGHCKRLVPIWNTLTDKEKYPDYSKKLDFIVYDSVTDKEKIKEWDISGFPTIMIVKNGIANEYNGPREMQDMIDLFDTLTK